MVAVGEKSYTFEEYLEYDDGTDIKYELFNGQLIPMPPASGIHVLIMNYLAKFLFKEIEKSNLDWELSIGGVGVRTDTAKSRIPDLLIMTPQQCEEIEPMRSAVIQSSSLLAIEIVSPGNAEQDYRYKRSEYAVKGIDEYWIVDPITLKVSILTLVSGFYEVAEYEGETEIISPTFAGIKLTPEMIFETH